MENTLDGVWSNEMGRWCMQYVPKHFCVMDIGLWKEGKILSWRSKLHIIIQANAVTLKISNKNNGHTGQTLHHDTTGPKVAVAALPRQVHHILCICSSEYSLICNVFDNKQWTTVKISEIIAAVRVTEKSLNLQSHVIDPDLIGARYLWSGITMALKLKGFSDSTKKKW